MEELILQAKVVLANQFAFYLKAQSFHWNVEGTDFKEYHDLFGDIYEEVYESVDVLAEEVRAMDAYAPGSLGRFIQLSQVQDENAILPAREMAVRLLADMDIIQRNLKMAYDLAEKVGLHGYSNLMAERQDAFAKHAWMLRASLKS